MTGLDDLSAVVCRPALSKDTEQVMELCSHIWDGGDYIPQVWGDWLADPDGLLGVAELSGRIVGLFKLTKFQEQEWYLEGLRVHPDFQGQGIAAHIHDYVLEIWQRMGKGIIRLTTASFNVKVHHMAEQSGFRRIAEFIPYRAPSLSEVTTSFTNLKNKEAPQALEYVLHNQVHALSSGLINLGWVYGDPQLKHIQEAILNKHAWWWRGGLGFLSIWEDEEDDEHEPGIQLVACPMSDLRDLLVDYRRLMAEIGYQSPGWVAPNYPEVLAMLEQAGFQRSWDISLYVYEYRSGGSR